MPLGKFVGLSDVEQQVSILNRQARLVNTYFFDIGLGGNDEIVSSLYGVTS